MASKNRSYDRKKLLGQVYTPFHIVDKILDVSGFYRSDLDSIKILDPACGDGRFLVPVVEYIVKHSLPEQLENRLSQVYGWDIDPAAIEVCRKNLDDIVRPLGIEVHWKLSVRDALRQLHSREKFDLIIGNPPYIRIQHLPEDQRKFIQKTFTFCRIGATDAFFAFFELASRLLSKTGVCGFITPNSFLTSQSGKALRSYFSSRQNLIGITNYGTIPVFGNTGTYPAITVFSKQKRDYFTFEQCLNADFGYEQRAVAFSEIDILKPWQLSVKQEETIEGQRLGDICQISVGVTTLADAYYLFSVISENNGIAFVKNKNGDEVYLEKELLKPIIKGSKLKTATDPITEFILFPYQKDADGKHRIIPEQILSSKFPQTFSYLLKVKPVLDRRDNGKANPVAWYAFGRAQGLDSSFGKKIIFSPMNKAPNFVLYENPDVTVYSGYFIKYDGDYQALLEQLNSQRMSDFIATAGRDFQGGYKGYNKKAIENFIVTNQHQEKQQNN
ncbi:Eco57I restriction-modification methylase domain-containing protein [Dyadobacter luticola]|uniref:site-specific DNA-methyltransferase (adenine-specific) n=1 Tax=Dyadobacter luticola TaxID=1979387 RepID=A0A5R9L3X7_9BACT|nr:N-6 DNA methylase [Dyadobacter luticola]TLV03087.1 methyltransferase domain-containing protein [Dyadobacter luticola]